MKSLPERTAFEKPLFEAFLKRGKPILGICRGSQLINVCLGGTLYQDLLAQTIADGILQDLGLGRKKTEA